VTGSTGREAEPSRTTDNQFRSPDNTSCDNAPLSARARRHTFTAAGTFPYYCSVHFSLGMTGTITTVQ
jgi:plastocyanin